MRYSYSLIVLLVYAAGAVLVELASRGMHWIGMNDVSYLFSGAAQIMLAMDVVLLIVISYRSGRQFLRDQAAHDSG